MKREEQKRKALWEAIPQRQYTEQELTIAIAALEAGAEWADDNPCWTNVDDELPEPNIKVLCYTAKGNYFVGWQKETLIGGNTPSGRFVWNQRKAPVIAWMYLPTPPKFD